MTFEQIKATDSLTKAMLEAGQGLEEVIIEQVRQKREAWSVADRLRDIAPCRYRLKDGTIFVWHCPDDLIPIQEL